MTIFHRRSCFHLYKYIYIFIYLALCISEKCFSSGIWRLHPSSYHCYASGDFSFLQAGYVLVPFFMTSFVDQFFALWIMKLYKNMFGGGGPISINFHFRNSWKWIKLIEFDSCIYIYIWYICFCSLNSSCMDSMGFEHQLLAPAARSCSKRRFRDEEEVPFKFVAAESRWTWQIWVPADPPIFCSANLCKGWIDDWKVRVHWQTDGQFLTIFIETLGKGIWYERFICRSWASDLKIFQVGFWQLGCRRKYVTYR